MCMRLRIQVAGRNGPPYGSARQPAAPAPHPRASPCAGGTAAGRGGPAARKDVQQPASRLRKPGASHNFFRPGALAARQAHTPTC